jgi:ATP-binding cassette, subfamily F, member 3
MIHARNVTLTYGPQTIFNNISFAVDASQRVGLVGRNGSGKSTMLKAIHFPKMLDSGTIAIANNKKIAYMPQEVVLDSDKSILDEALSVFTEITALQLEAEILEQKIETESTDDHLNRYAAIHERLLQLNPEQKRAHAERILQGLGFDKTRFNEPVQHLSVGWKMRIVLAKLLLDEADFYLFDEPTNHLDIFAKEWFLKFLQQASFGFLIVCHERYILNELCTHIFEIELGNGTMYTGDYEHYETEKEARTALLEQAYRDQQKDIKQKQETINRFRASASKAKMAQSMMKQLDKVERIVLPPSPRTMAFSFPPTQRSARTVLTVTNVSQHFGSRQIFKNVSFNIERGQKVALVAPNGIGKTTLFNIITGTLPLQSGSITFGDKVLHTIFDQDQSRALDVNKTIIENILLRCPRATQQTARGMLGTMLFSNDDVNKKVKVLSGGEKNRVGMTSVLLQEANLLLLDEPTNHLDIFAKQILLRGLQSYEGTMLFVSHDRDFINELATHVIELTAEGTHMYHGNYDDFTYQKELLAAHGESPQKKNVSPKAAGQESEASDEDRNRERDRRLLERKIEKLEQQIAAIGEQFAELDYGTPEFDAAQEKFTVLGKELKTATSQREALSK